MRRRSLAFVMLMTLAFILMFGAMVANVSADKVLIGFAKQPGAAEEALVRGAGGIIKYTYHIVPAIAADVPGPAIAQLRANRMVIHVHPDGRVHALDAELDNSWGVKRIGAGVVHDSGNKGTGVKVAIVDTGICYTHPDLDDNCADEDDNGIIDGYDFVNGDADPMDDNGHGTHVAGTVAAEDNGSGVVGVAPEAHLYALKVLDQTGSGNWSHVIAALEWSVDNGMQVINMSLGGGTGTSDVEAACQAAYDAGLLVVAAAGNTGNPPGRGENILAPAVYESVIAVGATDQSDKRASFSSTGPQLELMATGVGVNSTLPGGGYGIKSGTSMASPHVAGTAALVWVAYPSWTNADVRTQLQNTADDLGSAGWDSKYGYGLVDADEAAGTLTNNPPTVHITSPADGSPFDSGASISFAGTASDTEDGDRTASLVWTSSIDGGIGTGGSFSRTLSDGNHTITAEVTDSGGKTGSDSVSITVGTPPPEPTDVIVTLPSGIQGYATEGGKNGDKHLLVTVALENNLGNPVAGASVSILLDNTTTSERWTGTGTTGTGGTVTFSLKNAPDGCYTTTVTNVTAEGLTWDGIAPTNQFCKPGGQGAPPAYVISRPILEGAVVELRLVTPPVVKVERTVLLQNNPNPCNPETWIPFKLASTEHVVIRIYDAAGRLVRMLDLGHKAPGAYVSKEKAAYWDGRNESGEEATSGIYFYLMEAGSFRAMKKMIILK